MENSSLRTLLAAPEETEEPWPKKFKIDSNQVTFETGQQQLLEVHCEDTKSANKFLCFPKTSWNFNQHDLELKEKSSINLKTSVRQHANFKMYMNANLQSRLLGNIPYIGKWPPNSCTSIRNASCKFKKNNSDLIKLESLVSYAKESETVAKTANISKNNFRRNKVFQHRYTPYSRNCGNLNPKLTKGIALELFLQIKRTYHYSTVTENGTPVLNHIIQVNHQQTEKSNEEGTKKCLLSHTNIRKDDIFSLVCKEQVASQIILFNDQILPDKSFSIILWEKSLYIPETIHNLADNFRLLNYLSSIPIMFENKERMNKTQYGNHKHGQNNPCDFVDRKSHIDKYKKICLSSYSEEIEYISVLGNVIITDEKYSKGCIIADKRFTSNHFETLTYICVPLKLCTNCSSLLKQESKSKKSQYFRDSRWLKQVISDKLLPINSRRLLKHSLDINQYFTPDMFHNLCLNQNTAISVEAKENKTSMYGKRAKQSCFEFEKRKSVLQYQYQTTWISKVSKAPKAKKIRNVKFWGGKNILFTGTLMSQLVSVNQTAEDVNQRKNAIAQQSYINKSNQYQNLCELYFKEEPAKSANSVNKLTVASCSTKQKSFEDSREGHFSSETNRRDQFDLVLEELRMFNEISKENENSLSQAEINILEKEPLVLNCSDNIPDQVNRNIHQNSVISTTGITMSSASGIKQNSYKKSLFKHIQSGEHEIPHDYCSSSISDKELFCSSSEERAYCKQSFPWKPAFITQTLMKEGSYNLTTEKGNSLLSGIRRVQPLKTCCGPLRVGLSRKAKLKQLHPYLK
ncbi:RAD51-associated protein 2 [Python bivittatus]|uniref:RAD51-associated protein 2 n=1 Tax=Python bivittatus TaxID=176946 RepID=A0A9F5N2I4_PYTBI|nr:RAD51-associated protein 2 [Python bivittatus]